SFAIGNGAHADSGNQFAVGHDSWSLGYLSMALAGAWADGSFACAVQSGVTRNHYAFASTWSTADGIRSCAIAGSYTGGARSFAANAAVTMADRSNAIGWGTVARLPYQMVVGTY